MKASSYSGVQANLWFFLVSRCKGRGDAAKVPNEAPTEVAEAKEGLNGLDGCRLTPGKHCFDLLRVNLGSIYADDEAEKLGLGSVELALLQVRLKPSHAESPKVYFDVRFVF